MAAAMVDFEVPEDSEIQMVARLQSLGEFLAWVMPTELKDCCCMLASMATGTCVVADPAPVWRRRRFRLWVRNLKRP